MSESGTAGRSRGDHGPAAMAIPHAAAARASDVPRRRRLARRRAPWLASDRVTVAIIEVAVVTIVISDRIDVEVLGQRRDRMDRLERQGHRVSAREVIAEDHPRRPALDHARHLDVAISCSTCPGSSNRLIVRSPSSTSSVVTPSAAAFHSASALSR